MSNIKSPYSTLLNSYLRSEYHTVQSILKHIEGFNMGMRVRYPLMAVLQAVSKTFLISSFEWLYLGLWLEENDWKVDTQAIRKYRLDFPEMVFVSDTPDERGFRGLILYLYLISFSLKEKLVESNKVYTAEIKKVCPKFLDIYREWIREDGQPNFEFDSKKINRFYKRVTQPSLKTNYNFLVDQIIQITPSYLTQRVKLCNSKPESIRTVTIEASKDRLSEPTNETLEIFLLEDPFGNDVFHYSGELSDLI